MNLPRRYAYNPPWRQIGAAFCLCAFPVILAFFVGLKAHGFPFWSLVILGAPFVFLAFGLLVGRVAFPRSLELTEDYVLLPSGFMRKRIRRIAYTDISSSWEYRTQVGAALHLVTPAGGFEILAPMLPDPASYQAIKSFVQAKTALNPGQNNPSDPPVNLMPYLPESACSFAILRWQEPKVYERYRTHLVVTAQPLAHRIFKTLAFNCYWFFPGLLVLWLFHQPLGEYLAVSAFAAPWFALLYWSNLHHPARCGELRFHHSYIYGLNGKQSFSVKYPEILGWTLIERPFEGQPIHLLLLKFRQGHIYTWALPDIDMRNKVASFLRGQQAPETPELAPPWDKN